MRPQHARAGPGPSGAGISRLWALTDREPDPARCMSRAGTLLEEVGEEIARWLHTTADAAVHRRDPARFRHPAAPSTLPGMTYIIDPDVLEQSSRDLIRHGLDLDEATRILFPDTGSTAGYGEDALEQLAAHVETTAGSLRDVGEAAEQVAGAARLTDGEVGELFDLTLALAFR